MNETRRQAVAPHVTPPPVFGLILLGICVAIVEIFLGFFPSGAGHGWAGPLIVSFPLIVILPVMLVRFRIGTRRGLLIDIAIAGLAVAANYFLIDSSLSFRDHVSPIHDESFLPGVVRSVLPFFFLWLMIWGALQLVAMLAVVRRVFGRKAKVVDRD